MTCPRCFAHMPFAGCEHCRPPETRAERCTFKTELTPEGEQYVIPGAEQKAPAGKPHQGNLWDGKR